jgi:hypothetical protein
MAHSFLHNLWDMHFKIDGTIFDGACPFPPWIVGNERPWVTKIVQILGITLLTLYGFYVSVNKLGRNHAKF